MYKNRVLVTKSSQTLHAYFVLVSCLLAYENLTVTKVVFILYLTVYEMGPSVSPISEVCVIAILVIITLSLSKLRGWFGPYWCITYTQQHDNL